MNKLNEMWKALEKHQPIADRLGYGQEWKQMCVERTEDACRTARDAARAARAARDAVYHAAWDSARDAARDARDAAYDAAWDAALSAARDAAHAARAARDAVYAARAAYVVKNLNQGEQP